jgi:8-oxo-dGTP pyrophosphatase MutT (NUDIX family)
MIGSVKGISTIQAETLVALQGLLPDVSKSVVLDQVDHSSAAVMVLLFIKNNEWHVLLNKRSESLQRHKGEICFPGGVWDPQDTNHYATATRETQEEIGIHPSTIQLIGDLDPVAVSTGFLVRPVVGCITYPYSPQINSAEVAKIIEVPISLLMDPSGVREQAYLRNGTLEYSYSYVYEGQLVYGATARILTQFLEFLAPLLERS